MVAIGNKFPCRHNGSILNFKSIHDPATREIYIASKSFSSLEEMLDYYTKHSLKARGRETEKILLRYPIPVDKKLETIHRMAQDELYATLAGKLPATKPTPPSPSTKPNLKKPSVEMGNKDSIIKENIKSQEAVLSPVNVLKDTLTVNLSKDASSTANFPKDALTANLSQDDSAENLLNQALQQLEELNTEIATLSSDAIPIDVPSITVPAENTVNEKPVSPPDQVSTIPPPREAESLPTTTISSEIVKSSTASESITPPSSEQKPTTNEGDATSPVLKSKTAPPPAPPPLPPIAEPTAVSTMVGSKVLPTTPGSVSSEDLLEMQQKLKKTLPRDTSLSKSGGIMHDIFDQFNDKISLMRSMVEHSDDEDYEELEWD